MRKMTSHFQVKMSIRTTLQCTTLMTPCPFHFWKIELNDKSFCSIRTSKYTLISAQAYLFSVEDVKKSRIWGLYFALSALPAILAESSEDIVDPADWCEAMNESDQLEKEKKMKKMMEMSSSKVSNSQEMGHRIAELFDELIEAGHFSENL